MAKKTPRTAKKDKRKYVSVVNLSQLDVVEVKLPKKFKRAKRA